MSISARVPLFVTAILIGSAGCSAGTGDSPAEGPSRSGDQALAGGGGGSGGTSFTCNEPDSPGMCYCEPPETSSDCQAMQKNCNGPITCGWLVTKCSCHAASQARPPSHVPPRPPVGARRTPG